MMSDLTWVSIVLCLVVGSAIDTGNLCLIRAARDLIAGKPAVAFGVLLVTACAAIVFYLNTRLTLHFRSVMWSYPTWITCVGAVVFATGSLVNGACAVGTIMRLARGDVGHLATIAGALGVAFMLPRALTVSQPVGVILTSGSLWLMVVLAFTGAMGFLCRRHLREMRFGSYMVVGVIAALVADWQGDWTWLNLVRQIGAGVPNQYTAIACIVAVVVSAGLTAMFRGRFRFKRTNLKTVIREAAGGGLMVAGAILIPGANDALSVYGVPSGSPNAVVGYIIMLAVILMVVILRPTLMAETAREASGPL